MKRINKYLFLDVDGVLNSVSWYRAEWNKDHVYPQGDFDPKCVEIVNRIVKETGCKVVVSSSWRAEINLQSIFDKAGLKFKIHSITPFGVHRGCEIRDWLASETEPYVYAILMMTEVCLQNRGSTSLRLTQLRVLLMKTQDM